MRQMSAIILMAVLLPSFLPAQGFWIKKEYHQWTLEECLRFLGNSPWAKSRTITSVLIQPLSESSTVPGREAIPQITYVAQIWSAPPIRQAMVRKTRLSREFTKLSSQQQQAFEAEAASVLEGKFPDRIEIRVEYSTTAPVYERALAMYWQSRPLALWTQDTFLITSSGQFAPVDVRRASGAGGYFVLVFPREANGRPVIRPTDKSFALDFHSPGIERMPGERILLEFRLKDMLIQGNPVF